MSDKKKSRSKKKGKEFPPRVSLKFTIPPLRRVVKTPLKDSPLLQVKTGGITTADPVLPEPASPDSPVAPPPAHTAMDNAPQEPEDDIEITPYRPSTLPAASKTATRNQQVTGTESMDSEDSMDETSPTPVRKTMAPATKNSRASARKDNEKFLRESCSKFLPTAILKACSQVSCF